MNLRPALPSDRDDIIALIDGVYREYGDRVRLDGADRDLLELEQHYHGAGGVFVVLEDEGGVRGTHAVLPLPAVSGLCTLRRLYLDRPLRGGRSGHRLMQWALHWAEAHGYRRIEFWSDTRYRRAHRFFEKNGFQRDGRVRDMNDGWTPYQEFFFFRSLSGR